MSFSREVAANMVANVIVYGVVAIGGAIVGPATRLVASVTGQAWYFALGWVLLAIALALWASVTWRGRLRRMVNERPLIINRGKGIDLSKPQDILVMELEECQITLRERDEHLARIQNEKSVIEAKLEIYRKSSETVATESDNRRRG